MEKRGSARILLGIMSISCDDGSKCILSSNLSGLGCEVDGVNPPCSFARDYI